MTRKALVVGVNYYGRPELDLAGCVNDAKAVADLLQKNYDDSPNFDTNLLTAEDGRSAINRCFLRQQIETLFEGDADVALLYFAGHGSCDDRGGYIFASNDTEGIALNDVLLWANKSRCKHKIIILDSCFSGAAGCNALSGASELMEGVVILAACTSKQTASETPSERGAFTSILEDALKGAAANLVGEISPGSIYAHVDKSFGAWQQRPIFKANVKNFVSLRKTKPSIELGDLRKLTELFPEAAYEYRLDPTYEPEMKGRTEGMPEPIFENTRKFAILQKYNRVNLLVPVGAPHMWHAAMESKSCRLTALGRFYHMLVQKGRI